jgi:hypothetical protein
LLRRALAARLAAKMMLAAALWDGYPSRLRSRLRMIFPENRYTLSPDHALGSRYPKFACLACNHFRGGGFS